MNSEDLVKLLEEILSNPTSWRQYMVHCKDPILLPHDVGTPQEYFAKERARNIAAVLTSTFLLTPIE